MTEYESGKHTFQLGKGVTLREGKDVTIVATGMMVQLALQAAELLAAEGIDARVLDIHTVKPLDTELILKAAKETGAIVTSEEHSVIGGLGGAVAEFLSGHCPVPVIRHGVKDVFGRSGKAAEVLEAYGLTAEVLASAPAMRWKRKTDRRIKRYPAKKPVKRSPCADAQGGALFAAAAAARRRTPDSPFSRLCCYFDFILK